jgi:hypothetical protein
MVYKNINLSNSDKELMLIRYISIMKKIESQYRKNSLFYTWSNLFTSIASILVTAFISINNLKSLSYSVSVSLWWMAWSLALGISLVNTIGSFYKWDRKYLLLFKIYYKLEQEIWMYLELVGPYTNANKNNNNNNHNNHKNKLKLFLSRIESVYKRNNNNYIDIEESEQTNVLDKTNSPTVSMGRNNGIGANSANSVNIDILTSPSVANQTQNNISDKAPDLNSNNFIKYAESKNNTDGYLDSISSGSNNINNNNNNHTDAHTMDILNIDTLNMDIMDNESFKSFKTNDSQKTDVVGEINNYVEKK